MDYHIKACFNNYHLFIFRLKNFTCRLIWFSASSWNADGLEAASIYSGELAHEIIPDGGETDVVELNGDGIGSGLEEG